MTARLIRAGKLRAHLGVTGAEFRKIKAIIPGPLPGTRLYDFEAVKRALDRIGNPEPRLASDTERDLIERARQWGKSA